MAQKSKIEWTESTWNPVTGCTKISTGCKNCYAERMALRLKAIGSPNYTNGFRVTPHDQALKIPLRWKQSKIVFVNSMSDIFHQKVTKSFIDKMFDVMSRSPQHRYQILTKRSKRMLQLNSNLNWQSNIWMGVTVETAKYTYRIDHLKQTDAAIKFISFEPLLGPIPNIDLSGIDWVIVGGESGPGARPMKREWAAEIRDRCVAADVSFFFKQWGGMNKKKNGRKLDDKIWSQMPNTLELSYA